MAVAAVSQQLLSFSTSTQTRATATPKPWFPNSTSLFVSLKKSHASFISFSSSSTSQSPETNAETAESCVNLGLSLFSKGRVCTYILFTISIFAFYILDFNYGFVISGLLIFCPTIMLIHI